MRLTLAASVVALAALVAACGGGGSAAATSTSSPSARPYTTQELHDKAVREAHDLVAKRIAAIAAQRIANAKQRAKEQAVEAGTKSRMMALLDTADNLLQAASSIVAGVSTHRFMDYAPAGASNVSQFYIADQKFQTDVKDAFFVGMPENLSQADSQLGTAEQSLFIAVREAMELCDGRNARQSVKIAASDINEAHRNMAGKINEDYASPELDSDAGDSKCSGS